MYVERRDEAKITQFHQPHIEKIMDSELLKAPSDSYDISVGLAKHRQSPTLIHSLSLQVYIFQQHPPTPTTRDTTRTDNDSISKSTKVDNNRSNNT